LKTNSKAKSVSSIYGAVTKGKMTFDSYLQRKAGQWSNAQKGKLIDSILRGYPIPPVYAVDTPIGGVESIIDGCQRITTICDFMDNKFALSSDLQPVEVGGEEVSIARKRFNKLPEELQDKIRDTNLTVITLYECTNDELVAVFDRLNGGTVLSPAQKQKIYMSFDFAQHIKKIANLPTLSKCMSGTQIKRDTDQSVVVETLMLTTPEYTYGSTGGGELKKFLKFYSPQYKPEKLDTLEKLFLSLGTLIPDDCKTIKKLMIPGILAAAAPIVDNEDALIAYKGELAKFLADPTSFPAYTKYATLHTTTKENVEGRVAFFKSLV